MKLTLDQEISQLRIQMAEEEYQKVKIDADQRGLSVADMLQAEMDRIAATLHERITTSLS
jgi:hypothetical protein